MGRQPVMQTGLKILMSMALKCLRGLEILWPSAALPQDAALAMAHHQEEEFVDLYKLGD